MARFRCRIPAGVYRIIAMKYGFTPAIETIVPTKKSIV